MKNVITYCPIYDLTSPVLKVALGCEDIRTVRSRLQAAGVPIHDWGGRDVVKLEELLASIPDQEVQHVSYQAQSDLARGFEEL